MQPVQQAEQGSRRGSSGNRIAELSGTVLGEEEPHKGQVLVLAHEVGRVTDVEPSVLGPSGRRREVSCSDVHAGLHRGDGADIGVEAVPVERLGPVEQVRGGLEVATGRPHLCRRNEPPVPVLGDGGPLCEHPCLLEVRVGTVDIIKLPVELGQRDMQVRAGP